MKMTRSTAKVKTIFHAHNWKFADVASRLQELRDAGYDAVQLSPAQKSPAGDAWYLRYQPYDHLSIEGLGDRDGLTRLCMKAHQLGVIVIADLVFNHMAVPTGARREDWLAAEAKLRAGDERPMESMYAKLSWFPHLSRRDFAPWRDMQGVDWDNENRYESWGNGEWPELLPTSNVLGLHNRHIEILYDCGVRGFRFDAVKHMRVSHLSEYVKTIEAFAEPCWFYGEVFSDEPKMHREYDALFPTTDFPFITRLKRLLHGGLPVPFDSTSMLLSDESIRFGMNHDLAYNPKHLVAGFLFDTPEQTRLANCLALALRGGTVLVLADDHQRDEMLRACVKQRQDAAGLSGAMEIRQQGSLWTIASSQGQWHLDMTTGGVRLSV